MPSQLPQFWKINKADWSKFTELCENTLNSAGYLASTLEFGASGHVCRLASSHNVSLMALLMLCEAAVT